MINDIVDLQAKLDALQSSREYECEQIMAQKLRLEHKLEISMIEKTNFAVNKTKSTWYNEGQHSTKYFLNLEKQRYHAKCMKQIILDDGTRITERKRILLEQEKFYRELYSTDESVKFTKTNNNPLKRISAQDHLDLEKPLSQQELFIAMSEFKSDKTPGTDGIINELYFKFWDEIKDPLYMACLFAFKAQTMHSSARRGIISLLPKKDKDSLYLKNWRPITLLNVDYKILAKAVANRFKRCLDDIIASDQTGFMKGRNIASNTRKLLDIAAFADQNSLEAVIFRADFEKCFDKLEVKFLPKVLEYFNFGPLFTRWVCLLFTNMQLCTLNYGFISNWFPSTRGAFQGNPVSSYICLFYTEVLAESIRNNERIEGIKIDKNNEIKLVQFADDLNIPLMFKQDTVDAVLDELDSFSKQLGLTINKEKSLFYRIGKIKGSDKKLDTRGIKWTNESVSVLGVQITEEAKLEKANLPSVVNKMNRIFNQWAHRDLSIIGKITVINSLVASLFVYRMTVLPLLSATLVEGIHKFWSMFIWNKCKLKIALNTLQGLRANAGLNLTNLRLRDVALKVQWVDKVQTDLTLLALAFFFIQTPLINWFWKCNLKKCDVKFLTITSSFWKDVCLSWCQYNFSHVTAKSDVREQVIWWNSHIRSNNKPLWNERLFRLGLVQIKQLLTPADQFLTVSQFLAKFSSHLVTFLDYYQICQAIPYEWKRLLQTNIGDNFLVRFKADMILQYKSVVNMVYQDLNWDIFRIAHRKSKWENKLNIEIPLESFINLVNAMYCITNNVKLRAFHYRMLIGTIVTNKQLATWKVKTDSKCSFCHEEIEDVIHLFWECLEVRRIWNQVQFWLDELQSNDMLPQIQLSLQNVLLNNITISPKHVSNVIVLITKQYIYRQRCLEQRLNVYHLHKEFLLHNRMELMGALKTNKINYCREKWNSILKVLDI